MLVSTVTFDTAALVQAFQSERLMPVLRTDTAEQALWACEELYAEGFRIFDITLGTPDAIRVIESLSDAHTDIIVGAGTVLTPKQAMDALGAGAKFLLSPVLDLDMLQFCVDHRVPLLPGVTTPTEMMTAVRAGAEILKFFPAESVGGAAYLKTIRGPLPDLQVVPTGGIDDEHVTNYWQAGALAVGVGSTLVTSAMLATQDSDKLRKRAQQFLKKRDVFLDLIQS